ncbi:MAG: RNA 3'-terminal phosphate cyclase [Fimbriimonas sp.]
MASSLALIVIDGSHGEGGGALVRTALAMAALTQQPVRIDNVRGSTRFPGLDVEDLTVLRALQRICNAETVGAEAGSSSITFLPTRRPSGLNGPIESARSEIGRGPNANIVLSALLPVLARSGVYSSVSADGETYGSNSLSYEAFANVTLPALRKTGLYAFPDLVTAGFGRESAGTVSLDVEPSALHGIQWVDRGRLQKIEAVVVTAGVPDQIGERGVAHLKRLAQNSGVQMAVEHVRVATRQAGTYVATWAHYDRAFGGGSAMGARGLRVESLAQLAFEELHDWMATPSTVDPFLADQLLLPLVFAEGESAFSVSRLTQRFLTCVWVVKQFTPIHITIRGPENGPGSVVIRR